MGWGTMVGRGGSGGEGTNVETMGKDGVGDWMGFTVGVSSVGCKVGAEGPVGDGAGR